MNEQERDVAHNREVLAAIFASRVQLAKKTEEQAVAEARLDYQRNLAWVESDSQKVKSFRWFCDEFDLEPDAVRRAIRENR